MLLAQVCMLLIAHLPIASRYCWIEVVLWMLTGNTQAVLVHQLSKHTTQNPFRKNRGRVVRVLFHPLKPFLFVATQNHVRVYNLAQQALAKKLIGGSGSITSMAIHPGGDHVIVGSEVGPMRHSPVCNTCAVCGVRACVTIQAHP